MMMKNIQVWSLLLCCMLLLAACGVGQASQSGDTNSTSGAGNDAAEITNITVQSNGQEITIPQHPERIVDLSGSTEELLILDKKPVATMNADYGDQEKLTPTIADELGDETVNLGWYGMKFSMEAITVENPDLIILGADFNKDQYEALSLIAPTMVLPYSYYDWRERLTYLAEIFGEETKKDDYLSRFTSFSWRIVKIKWKTAPYGIT